MRNYIKVTSYTRLKQADRAEGREILLLFFDAEDTVAKDSAYKRALEAAATEEKAVISSYLPMPGYLGERDVIGTLLYNCGHWVNSPWGACPHHGRLREGPVGAA